MDTFCDLQLSQTQASKIIDVLDKYRTILDTNYNEDEKKSEKQTRDYQRMVKGNMAALSAEYYGISYCDINFEPRPKPIRRKRSISMFEK